MRRKFNMGKDGASPEAMPDILQEAVYNDDFVWSQTEKVNLETMMFNIQYKLDVIDQLRKYFDDIGGKKEYSEKGVLKYSIDNQWASIDKAGYSDTHFKILGPPEHRKIISRLLELEFDEKKLLLDMKELEQIKDRMVHVHTARGISIVAKENIKHGQNLDEISRGAPIREEDYRGLND